MPLQEDDVTHPTGSTPRPNPAKPGLLPTAALFFALFGAIAALFVDAGAMGLRLALISLVLAAALASLSAIDLATFRLPDTLTLPLLACGFALPWLTEGRITLGERGLAAVLAFAALAGIAEFYKRYRGRVGLGLGDAKLFAASGSWLGLEALSLVLLWATASSLAALLVSALRGTPLTRETRIPFGPFLAFGFWMVWISNIQ